MTKIELFTASKGDIFTSDKYDYILLITSEGDGVSVDSMLYLPFQNKPHVETTVKDEFSYTLDVFTNEIVRKLNKKDYFERIFYYYHDSEIMDILFKSARLKGKR